MAKNKRLTNKEKQARAELKKRMQDKGVLPPDKPKLNRKKFIDEAREEWNGEVVTALYGSITSWMPSPTCFVREKG